MRKPTCLLIFYFLVNVAWGSDYIRTQRVPFDLEINSSNALTSNDIETTFVELYCADDSSVVDTVGLDSIAPGRYYASYNAGTLLGSYIARYYIVFTSTSDTMAGGVDNFTIQDTGAYHGTGGCTSPTGTNSVTLNIKKTADSSAVSECLVQIKNLAENNLIWWDYTDSDGIISFMYDSDTLAVKLAKPLYSFSTTCTLYINSNEDTTYYGTAHSTNPPPNADMCRCYNYLWDLASNADTNAVIQVENLANPLRYGKVLISPYKMTTTADDTGYFYFDLFKSDSLTPDTSTYLLRIINSDGYDILYDSTGENEGIKFDVPNSTSWQITW